MESKNYWVKFAAGALCLLCLAVTAAAQKRRTPAKKTASRPAPTTTATPVSTAPPAASLEIRDGAQKTAVQLKNVTRFVYLLGSIAQGIEDVDKEIKSGRATRAAADRNAENKQKVLATLRNLRAGLVALEIDFRAKPGLRTYVLQIGGISDLTATAEEQAAAGNLTESGRTLLQVVEKLTDTLAAMP